jgi:hypothetical protein
MEIAALHDRAARFDLPETANAVRRTLYLDGLWAEYPSTGGSIRNCLNKCAQTASSVYDDIVKAAEAKGIPARSGRSRA